MANKADSEPAPVTWFGFEVWKPNQVTSEVRNYTLLVTGSGRVQKGWKISPDSKGHIIIECVLRGFHTQNHTRTHLETSTS